MVRALQFAESGQSMRAVILGARGQLGQELKRQLPDAAALGRADVDIASSSGLNALREIVIERNADVLLNAASNNQVDFAESDPSPALAVNSIAVYSLAQLCSDVGCRLVHFSTNYVFGRDRNRTIPYREDDVPAPVNAYGVSKLIGEELAHSSLTNCLVIRTAALFGHSATSRHNFLENMLAKAQSGQTVRIVNDQTIAPTRTDDLARAAISLAESGAAGVFHVNGAGETTWHELARRFFELAGVADRIVPVSSAELGAAAARPNYSVLSNDKYLSLGFAPPRHWRDAVDDYWRSRDEAGA